MFKVITGKLNGDAVVKNTNSGKQEKLSHLFFMRGKNQIVTDEIIAGDIGAVAKLQFTSTGDTLAKRLILNMIRLSFLYQLCQWQYFLKQKVMKKRFL